MVLRRLSFALVMSVACFLPATRARAGDEAPVAPHVVHVGDRVCLVYRRPDDSTTVRCRPEHGTWAEARMVDPTSLGLRLHAPFDPRASAAVKRGWEGIVFGTALTLTDAGVLAIVAAPALSCRSIFTGECNALDLAFTGIRALGLADVFLTIDAIVRGAWALQTGSIAPSPAAHHLWAERILYGAGVLLVEVGAVVGGLALEGNRWGQFEAGLVLCGVGAALLTADAIYRIYWDVDTTGFTISHAR